MKTLHFYCNSGAAGDMLTAALIELMPNPSEYVDKLNDLGIEGVVYEYRKDETYPKSAGEITVKIYGETEHEEGGGHIHHHPHRTLTDIKEIVEKINTTDKIKQDILSVYNIIAKAEAKVHGEEVNLVHFHEVGALDAVADIAAVCYLINEINPDRIVSSAVNVGGGTVKCAHGILPVPAPATALILEGIPNYSDKVIKTELCTPTGAALLKYFVSDFKSTPKFKNKVTGFGLGKKDLSKFTVSAFNCVTATLGYEEFPQNTVCELNFNVDDMTAEQIAFVSDLLLEKGALEVFSTPAYMKKSRLGTLVTVICREGTREDMLYLIFKHTTTIGVRGHTCQRYELEREIKTVSTRFGDIRVKRSFGPGKAKIKPEYDDVAAAAKEHGVTFNAVSKAVFEALEEG